MRNPFEDLSQPQELSFEEVGGAFTCQERGCWDTTTEAKYLNKEKVLTWICKNGHTSKIEDFDLNG